MKVYERKGAVLYPAGVAQMDEISLAAKGLYAYLLTILDPEHLTVTAIAIHLKENEKEIAIAMLQLEAFGLVAGSDGKR